ncbi:MAG TPA: DNA repair protein RadC [Edaphocola sp.]|nr:DNA repair protein RadC [Edaphocola sp.]
MDQFKPIKEWAEDDRPREKMILKGGPSLSDTELLGILINTGSVNKSAVDLARELMGKAQNNLHVLGRFSLKQFQEIKGIGLAKAVTLAAALELGRRRASTDTLERLKFSSSADVARFIIPMMQDLETEKFLVLYLNYAQKLITHEFISHGSLTASLVDIKILMRNALQHLASKIIIAHNHPSGNLQASQADIKLTKKIKEATGFFDIELLDHIIVAENNYTSLKDLGLIE